jgi:hypothetical protein
VNCLGRVLEPSATHSCSLAVHSCPPLATRVSLVRVARLATVDLRAELERCRSGEDGRVTIEQQRERHRFQGRNLDGDFDAVDTTPVRQTAHTPMPLVGFGRWLHVACPTPPHGGLTVQVLAPLAVEV